MPINPLGKIKVARKSATRKKLQHVQGGYEIKKAAFLGQPNQNVSRVFIATVLLSPHHR